MELALEADELAAVGPGQTVHDPFLTAAVPNRHYRPPPCEAKARLAEGWHDCWGGSYACGPHSDPL